MLIDWFTVAAQIVNFVVLVALMKRFLYGPLIKAIDEREHRIAAQVDEAAEKKKQAELEMQQVRQRIAELENRGIQIIADARSEADRKKHEMVEAARHSVRGLEQGWREDLRLEQTTFFEEIRQTAAGEILAITRNVLADLASADVERSAVQAFLEKLRACDGPALQKLSTVVSAAELSLDLRDEIEGAIGKITGSPVALRFERDPNMAWGIALEGDGQRIGWTPDAYLDSLEEKLKSALEQHAEFGSLVAAE